MRVVRNIVATGRTITVTIHQPAIDIFEVSSIASTPLKSVPAAGTERGLHSVHTHAVLTHAASNLASATQQLAVRMTLQLGSSVHISPVCVHALQACHALLDCCLRITSLQPFGNLLLTKWRTCVCAHPPGLLAGLSSHAAPLSAGL